MSGETGWAAVPNWLVRDTSVSIYAKAVYLALSSRAGAEGVAWPSHATIAAEAGCSERKVRDALTELRALGAVTWDQRADVHGRKSNRYRVQAHRSQETGARHTVPVGESSGVDRSVHPRHTVPVPPAHGAGEEAPVKKHHEAAVPAALIPSSDELVVDTWVDLQRKAGKSPRPAAPATRRAVQNLLRDGVSVDRVVAVLTWAHTDELRGSWWTNTGRLTLGTLRKHWATLDAQCPVDYEPPVDRSAQRAALEAAAQERTLTYAGLTEAEFLQLDVMDQRELTWRAEEDEARRAPAPPETVERAPVARQAVGWVAPSMVPDAWT